MRRVVDSCVGFMWPIVEINSDKARRLRDDFRHGLAELIALDPFALEIAYALTRAERRGRITPQQGAQFLTDVLKTLPQLYPSLPLLPRAYEVSSTHRVGVYDCLYVALAEREGCELVT